VQWIATGGLLQPNAGAAWFALANDFEAHGKGVVEKVRKERPQDYLKIVASIIPKQMELEEVRRSTRRAEDMTDDELVAAIDELRSSR
jgi:hypothetical protein